MTHRRLALLFSRCLVPLLAALFSGSTWATSRVSAAQDRDEVLAPPLEVRGQLVDEQGAPVVGVVPRVHGWEANDDLVRRYGRPADWQDPVPAATDAQGNFVFTFRPPNAYQFTVDVEAEGYGRVGWRWSTREYVDAGTLDLGRTVLERPAVIEGHVENADGELQVEGWRVMAWHRVDRNRPGGPPRDGTIVHVPVDPETGTFRIANLPPGRVELSASHGSGTRIDDVMVDSKAGQVTRATLVMRGPDPRTRIVLTIFTHPFYVFDPEPGHVHAIAASGERIRVVPVPGRSNDWHAVDLEEGVYSLEIDDPRFEPWRLEEVRTGSNPSAHLKGSAGLELTVLGVDGERVERAGVHIRFENATFSPDTVTLVEDGDRLPADGRFAGVVPGNWVLRVVPPNGVEQYERVAGLAPGETRRVVVRLGGGGTITGTVRSADGTPLPGARVQRTLGDVHGHDGPPGATTYTGRQVGGAYQQIAIRYRDEEVLTDAQGRYTFRGLPSGPHAVRALLGTYAMDDGVVDVVPEETVERNFTLPASGDLLVRVLLPENVPAKNVLLNVQPSDPTGGSAPHLLRVGRNASPDASEARRFEDLPVGEALVLLQLRVENGPGWSTRGIRRTPVTIREGQTTELELDLRETFPVDGRVRVTDEAGAPLLAQVTLRPDVVDRAPTGPAGEPAVKASAVYGDPADGEGWARLVLTPPGTYRPLVEAPRLGWSWRAPEPLTVHPRTPFEFELRVPLVRRTLRVLDAEGNPRPGLDLHWAGTDVRWTSAHATTDREGQLELRLPPGPYRLVPTPADHDPNRGGLSDPQLEGASTFTLEAGEGVIEIVIDA